MKSEKKVYFTLIGIIVVLLVSYVAIPEDKVTIEESRFTVEEVSVIDSMQLEQDVKTKEIITNNEEIISSASASIEEKNNAFENINLTKEERSLEEKIEEAIIEEFGIKSFVEIDGKNVNVCLMYADSGSLFAAKIIRKVNSFFEEKKFVSVKFEV